jgi:hypothetical protein
MKKKRAGTQGQFKREGSEVFSLRMSVKSISRLNVLAVEYGGAGRAIQTAVEFIVVRKRQVASQSDEGKPRKILSFAAFPRTRRLMVELCLRYDVDIKSIVLVCIELLKEISDDEKFFFDPAFRPDDEPESHHQTMTEAEMISAANPYRPTDEDFPEMEEQQKRRKKVSKE